MKSKCCDRGQRSYKSEEVSRSACDYEDSASSLCDRYDGLRTNEEHKK